MTYGLKYRVFVHVVFPTEFGTSCGAAHEDCLAQLKMPGSISKSNSNLAAFLGMALTDQGRWHQWRGRGLGATVTK